MHAFTYQRHITFNTYVLAFHSNLSFAMQIKKNAPSFIDADSHKERNKKAQVATMATDGIFSKWQTEKSLQR